MTQIGLGTAAIGRPVYINIKDDAVQKGFDKKAFKNEGLKILDFAYENGIIHFDTAPGYGLAEALILEWLATNKDENINVFTKWGYTYVANFDPNASKHEVKEHSLAKLNEQWQFSQQLLPKLKLYQIHSATFESGVLENEAVLNRLYHLKKEKDIEIGLTSSGKNQADILKRAMEVTVENENLFTSFQITYNVFDQSLYEIKQLFEQYGSKLIVKESIANGRVFPNDKYPHYKESYKLLQNLATKYKVGVDAIALRFVMDSLSPYIVLSGASTQKQLTENLKANSFQLNESEIKLLQQLKVKTEDYWTERSALTWR